MSAAATLSTYLRAARRKHADPPTVFETAAEQLGPYLSPAEAADALARVVGALRDAHPEWRLPRLHRDPLIDALLNAGRQQVWIAEHIGCSRRTVARRASTRAAVAQAPLEKPINKRSRCAISGARGGLPILSFSSAGTPWAEHSKILEVLGAAR